MCDALWPVVYGQEALPYPPGACISIAPDRRIRAMISLDGSSQMMRWRELDRIAIPSLIMGENVENSEQVGILAMGAAAAGGPPMRDWIARPHAAIARPNSYRADVDGSNHYSYSNYCDAAYVFYNLGLATRKQEKAWLGSWPCVSTGLDAVTISSTDEHKAVTEYMVAFLDVFLGRSTFTDWYVLTPQFALSHAPAVEFFTSETCSAALPSPAYFTYPPHQTSSECDVALKDPTGWFAQSREAVTSSASSAPSVTSKSVGPDEGGGQPQLWPLAHPLY